MAEVEDQRESVDVLQKYFLANTFTGDHTVFKFTDIVMDCAHSTWDSSKTWQMFSLSMYARSMKLNQLLTPYNHIEQDSNVPHVHSVVFRFPPAPINSAPCVFKLHLSNLSELKGYWSIISKPAKGWTKQLIKSCINCGSTTFKDDHFVDSPDLSAQLWAKKFRIATGTNYKIPPTCNPSKELSLFEVSPTSGCLKGKDSDVITFKFNHNWIGTHEVSVLLRIYPAIFVWIDLRGRTLDLLQPHLQLMNERKMKLHPVCLSDLDPPAQFFWMYNGGNSVASFTVDLEPFEKLKDENFGHSVIKCLTPKGNVYPKSWFPIKIRFSPLEYTQYSVSLNIYPSYDKSPMQSTLYGTAAINSAISLRPAATAGTARKFALFAHGVPVTLSPSHVTIGHLIPTGHTVTRIVFLTNFHTRNTMKYAWQNIPIEGGGVISFHPNCGRLAPKEEVSCKLIIKAGNTAAVLSTMIACTIEDETANVIYEFVLNQWRDYMKNKQLRDNVANNSSEVTHKPEKPETCNRLLAVSLYIGSTFGQYDNIRPKERSRMGLVNPLNQDQGHVADVGTINPFTQTGVRFCQSILSDIIWDMIQSPAFSTFVREATKRKAPLFEEYADAEQRTGTAADDSGNDIQEFALQSTSDILERAIFNIMHEMAERYAHTSTSSKWYDVPPVQPKALVDVEKHKCKFQLKP